MKKRILFFMFCCFGLFTANAIPVSNKIVNSNMESQGAWLISYLNTSDTQYPAVTWNYTAQVPAAGVGGALYVLSSSTSGNAQVCLYQPIHLSGDSVYNFDAAFKNLKLERSWCEVFIGKAPVTGEDYGDALGTKIANYGSWDNPAAVADGTFKLNAAACKQFVPDSTGTYFFVIKMGATTWDTEVPSCEIVVDELSLTAARIAPVTAFNASVRSGFAPLSVKFTDATKYATSWAWDFGDGGTSTEKSPTHIFSAVGKYNVSLTATNEIGTNVKTETEYINVTPLAKLTGGGLLKGGAMSSIEGWTADFLDTPDPILNPVATWNNTEKAPSAGQEGCLNIAGPAGTSSQTIQYAIWQKVHMSVDSVYVFDGAFKDNGVNLKSFWLEVYVGIEPTVGADYTSTQGTMIAKFGAWDAGSPVAGLDGTFKIHSSPYSTFTPTETGDYYFVIKLGTYGGSGFDISLDELSLKQTRTKPAVNFSATNAVGFPSLTTQFVNLTKFATSYSWNFGDGSAVSTLEHPEHTYTVPNTYSVTLTASNEKGDSILVKTDLVKVNEKPTLPAGEMLYGGNMENGNFWSVARLIAADPTVLTWNYTDAIPTGGEGGSLRLENTGSNFNMAIYQEVQLKKDYSYVFDGLYKDIKGIADYWCEVYVGTVQPVDGTDYSSTMGTQLLSINTWNGSKKFMDGPMRSNLTILPFKALADGTYYFVFKMGSNKAGALNEILLDNLSLKETLPITTDFYAETLTGDAPLSVQFYDLSLNATAWSWNFGDGGTSIEQSPIHIYTQPGTYTVTLIASNTGSSSTLVQTDLIVVTGVSALESGKLSQYNVRTENNQIKVDGVKSNVNLYDVSGRFVQSQKLTGSFTSKTLNPGMYFVKIDGVTAKVSLTK